MTVTRKLSVAAAVSGLAASGLLAFSAPASATGYMYCDPGTSPSGVNYAICSLSGAASPSNSRWTFDGTYLSSYDNLTFVRFACGGTGGTWTVSVTFTDDTGATASDTQWGTCGGRPA